MLLHTYNRFPVVLERGDGVRLYDVDGKEYLDFAAGIAVFALGYNNQKYNQALKEQIDKVIHTSNLFYNVPMTEAAEKLVKATGLSRVFFTNSGTEAIEGALKIAKRYHYNKLHEAMGDGADGCEDSEPDMAGEIIAMNHSFHGRSLGALSVTGNAHYQEPFKPLIPGIKFAEFNNLESVKALINRRTCAVILETVQGEGGIYPATEEFLKGVRALCDQYGLLMILDEIQCGMGRTGHMFAWQGYGVKPDVMTVAKALGNGMPVGAFLACGPAATAMVPGDHGTTYGGNPLVTAAAAKVLDLFAERKIVEHVREIGGYLWDTLEKLAAECPLVKDHRGVGLIQGLEFTVPVGPVVQEALLEQKLILISAGANVIRFVPPLVIEKEDVDEMARRLKMAIGAVES